MDYSPISRARDFIAAIELPVLSQSAGARFVTVGTPPIVNFDSTMPQALVVGSELISFTRGVDPGQRNDVVNAMLLAQLHAKKVAPQPDNLSNLRNWYRAYFDVLSQIGFVTQLSNLQKYHSTNNSFEAHEAVLEVAATLLVGAPAALAVMKSTLAALQKMDDSNRWITLFNQESRSAHSAHFQVTTADHDSDDNLFVALTVFSIEAKSKITQVLFFKFHSKDVMVEHSATTAMINSAVLSGVRQDIAEKLSAFTSDFIGNLEI